MRSLTEDREEVTTEAERRFVQRARRDYGIRPAEPTCWFVVVEQETIDPPTYDSDTKWLGCSPGDALAYLDCMAKARRDGVGRATIEVFGDGVNRPTIARVYPLADKACPSCGSEVES